MRRFTRILLVENPASTRSASLQKAVLLAKNHQASLTICAVVEPAPSVMRKVGSFPTPAKMLALAVEEKRDQLAKIAAELVETGISIECQVLVGKPFLEITRRVRENSHDLVIKDAEGALGLKGMIFGSTDMNLMRVCPCPVWIVKSKGDIRVRRILAALDRDVEDSKDFAEDELNRRILEMATTLALAEFSELHIVHAWRLEYESYLRSPRMGLSKEEVDSMAEEEKAERTQWLENLVNTFGTSSDRDATVHLEPQLHVTKGDARRVVPATARDLDIDLVVVGTASRTGMPGFFIGNTAESILNQIDCSVLTIKPPAFVGPFDRLQTEMES